MKHPLHYFLRSAIIIFTLLVLLGVTSLPGAAQQEFGTGLEIKLVSAPPKHAKACDTFEVKYAIHNPGPDNAANVYVLINVPDPFEVTGVYGAPDNLGPGESAQVTARIKVVAFVPGESRQAWIRAVVSSDADPEPNLDPNPGMHESLTTLKLIAKQVNCCP